MTKRLVALWARRLRRVQGAVGAFFASTATAASMRHPVTSRPSRPPSRRRKKTLAKWWGVLFCLPFPNHPRSMGLSDIFSLVVSRLQAGARRAADAASGLPGASGGDGGFGTGPWPANSCRVLSAVLPAVSVLESPFLSIPVLFGTAFSPAKPGIIEVSGQSKTGSQLGWGCMSWFRRPRFLGRPAPKRCWCVSRRRRSSGRMASGRAT